MVKTEIQPVSDRPVRILGIETSCDETAAAVVEDGRVILSNVVASQAELHAQFGGVFPEVASRQHIRSIYAIVQNALQQAHLKTGDLDAIAVTRGPGLPGSLVVGINAAKGLALASGRPLLGVNHLEGHLYAAWLDWAHSDGASGQRVLKEAPRFPLVALIVSGGHTELLVMRQHLHYQHLGATLDDAAGEAFDKVARLLGLGYPGGPAIQQAADDGAGFSKNEQAFDFPRAWLERSWNFSFSGLKTAVLREVRRLQAEGTALPVGNLAASFQAAVVDVLVGKTMAAAEEFQARDILVVGGVSANLALRQAFQTRARARIHLPPLPFCTDNAAMIAAAGYYRYCASRSADRSAVQEQDLDMDVLPNWPLAELSA